MWLLMLIILNKAVTIAPVNHMIEHKIKVSLIIPARDKRVMVEKKKYAVKNESLDDSYPSPPHFDIVSLKWDKEKVKVHLKLDDIFPVSAQIYIRNKFRRFVPASSYWTFIPQSKILHFVIPYQKLGGNVIILKIQADDGEINILKEIDNED